MPNTVTRQMNTPTDDLLRDVRKELGPGSKITLVAAGGNVSIVGKGSRGSVKESAKTFTVALDRALKGLRATNGNGHKPAKRTRKTAKA